MCIPSFPSLAFSKNDFPICRSNSIGTAESTTASHAENKKKTESNTVFEKNLFIENMYLLKNERFIAEFYIISF
ncbi:hypothetical protein LEP1GSC120_2502 [Leptospira santarosai str. 200702252]|nr:hypothetical protein LEP1GSC130_1660 [Leptospira santarosai str. 200403458]EMO99459.1 hypothetical protein LEP1GSC120_2502 [Leptospira santarosai str. 200702252]